MSTDSSDEDLMPEELLQGLTSNSREIYSGEELAEFLEEWSDKDGFAEDLEFIADFTKLDNVPPEKVFEHLASTKQDYTIEQMVNLADCWSNQEWKSYPEVSGTGGLRSLSLAEKISVPREECFIPLSGGYLGETNLNEKGKHVWMQEHSDGWYQTEVNPLDKDELMMVFRSLEKMDTAPHLHEANYEGEVYLVDSKDIEFFFEFEDEFFDGDLYRFESEFGDFYFEATKLPEKEEYRAMIFSSEGDTYPLDAYESIFSDKMVKGLKTRLEL